MCCLVYKYLINLEESRTVIQKYGSRSKRPFNYGSTGTGSGYTTQRVLAGKGFEEPFQNSVKD
jgi:hypothetical protein